MNFLQFDLLGRLIGASLGLLIAGLVVAEMYLLMVSAA